MSPGSINDKPCEHGEPAGRTGRKRPRTQETRRGDHESGRHLFDTLPFELLAEILVLTESPRDVLAVARCSKFFCRTLIYPPSAFIWKSVRKSCSIPPPEPISTFTEISYAAFLYGGGLCEVCKKHTDLIYCSFGIRLRLCPNHACKVKFTENGDHKQFEHRILPHDEKIKQCIPYIENNRCLRYKQVKLYRESDSVREVLDCAATPNEYLKNNKMKIAFIKKYMEFCTTLDEWKQLRQKSYDRIEALNENFSKQLAQKYGWVYYDLINSTPYGSMLRLKTKRLELVTQPDYDSVAPEVGRLLAKLLEDRERKAREATYLRNHNDVAVHHQRLRSKQPPIVLPSLEVFRRLPIIEMLQGTSPATVEYPLKDNAQSVSTTLQKQAWVVERLNTELRQWREKAKKDLSVVLGFSDWKTASSKVLHPMDRITALFSCKVCSKVPSRYRETDCFDFAGACAHACRTTKKDKKVDGVWMATNFAKDEKAIMALKKLLALCELDESLPEAATALESRGASIMCTTCQPGILMTSRSVIGHSHRHERMEMRLVTKEEATKLLAYPFLSTIVRITSGSEPVGKAIRAKVIFGCRHCFNLQWHATPTLETQIQNPPTPATSSESASADTTADAPQSGVAKGEIKKPKDKRFSFPGITSHLKEK
ncbi:hypothetical protein DXG01_000327 [Tephrocybe rancida]|nr:hypothetical protein DXG01_000327 [Tephrocybe rancida]